MAEQEPEQLPLDPAQETKPVVEPEQEPSQEPTPGVETDSTPPAPAPEPEEDFRAQAQQEREERIRLEERLRVQEATPPAEKPEPPKEYTRQQLREAVNAGSIDEDQMEEVWAKQQRTITRREVREDQDARDERHKSESRVESEHQKYLEARPEINRQGTDDRERVQREYDYYISLGDPPNKTTEVKAMRSVFGAPEKIREKTRDVRETTSTTSGGTGGGGGDRNVDIFNKIPPPLREHYRSQYKDGYKSIEDIEAELPYMKKGPQ